MTSYLHPHEVDYYADPADPAYVYPQLLAKTRATAERAALLIRQVTALHAEVDRLRELTQPAHKCSRCGGHDECPKTEAAA